MANMMDVFAAEFKKKQTNTEQKTCYICNCRPCNFDPYTKTFRKLQEFIPLDNVGHIAHVKDEIGDFCTKVPLLSLDETYIEALCQMVYEEEAAELALFHVGKRLIARNIRLTDLSILQELCEMEECCSYVMHSAANIAGITYLN